MSEVSTRIRTGGRSGRGHRLATVLTPLILAAVTAACGGPPAAEPLPSLQVPDFRLASLDGLELGPSSFAGDIVVFDFWASWCLPCHVQNDILKALWDDFDGRGVEFVAVNVGEAERLVREFVAEKPFPYPVLMDPNDEVSAQLGIYGLPTVMVLDHRGDVAFLRMGVSPERDLRDLLENLLREAAGGDALAS